MAVHQPSRHSVSHREGDAGLPVPCPAAISRAVLVATIVASSMVFIDGSVVNVILPTLQQQFGATAAQAQWVVESYALLLAALILVGGALGDKFGRKRIFLLGTVLFAATSVACGLAPTIEVLIGARALQGIAGALLTPASLAIISATYADETERGRAIGTWSGMTSIIAAGGPVLGGWLVDSASWRWVFFLNIPLALIVLAVARNGVPESRDETAGRLDLSGAGLATVGLGALVFGLIEAPVRGWGDPLVLVTLAVGVLGLVAFVVNEARVASPMLPLTLFRSATFTGANLLTLLLYGAFGGALFWLPFNLIQVQGYSATAAGAAFVPAILIVFGLSRWTGGLIGKVGAKLPLTVGPAIVAVGLVLLAVFDLGGSYWTTVFPAAVVFGIGMAITIPPLTTAVLGAVPANVVGIASGVNNAVARAASLLAIAVFGILVAGWFMRGLAPRLDAVPELSTDARAAVIAQAPDLAAAEPPADLAPDQAAAVSAAVDAAFIDGFRLAMFVGAGMALTGAALAFWLVAGKPAASNSNADTAAERASDPGGGESQESRRD